MAECNRVVFHQWTQASVASSTSSTVRRPALRRLQATSRDVAARNVAGEQLRAAGHCPVVNPPPPHLGNADGTIASHDAFTVVQGLWA